MNFYFGVRIISLFSIVIGSFLVTYSVWSVYFNYWYVCSMFSIGYFILIVFSSMFHQVLKLDDGFTDIFIPQSANCLSSVWSEWTSCKKGMQNSTRSRENSGCVTIKDSKPCSCPMKNSCQNITIGIHNDFSWKCVSIFVPIVPNSSTYT